MTIPYENTVSSSSVLDLLDTTNSFSIISNDVKLPERDAFTNPETRINEQVIIDLWHLIDKESRVPSYGLIFGQHIHPSSKGLLGSLVSQCETLKDAFMTFIKYLDWMNPSESWQLIDDGQYIDLIFSVNSEKRYPIASVERGMSWIVSWARTLTGKDVTVIFASFVFTKPHYHELFKLNFGKNIIFSSSQNCIRFSKALFDQKLLSYNPYLKDILERKLKSFIAKSKRKNKLSGSIDKETVHDLILIFLPKNKATIDYICNYLSISRQTLFRQLKKENTNFKTLLDSTRKDLAIDLLNDKNNSIQRVSEMLGYAEVSSFYTAFVRWHNTSVSQYRKKRQLIDKPSS